MQIVRKGYVFSRRLWTCKLKFWLWYHIIAKWYDLEHPRL